MKHKFKLLNEYITKNQPIVFNNEGHCVDPHSYPNLTKDIHQLIEEYKLLKEEYKDLQDGKLDEQESNNLRKEISEFYKKVRELITKDEIIQYART